MFSNEPHDNTMQLELMRKYVVFRNKKKIRLLLGYAGYFRVSRYGKYLLSYTSVIRSKPSVDMLVDLYMLDVELRKLFFHYCKKSEIQFKCLLANAVSLKESTPTFYLDRLVYTDTKSENDKKVRESNKKFFVKFFKSISDKEKQLRADKKKYPELREYRKGGPRAKQKIPCWAAFSYFELGVITNLYAFLRGDLRKEVLAYGYSRDRYGKETTKQMDTWLDAVRNLRNVCAHHSLLVGRTSSIVLFEKEDQTDPPCCNTDLFSRMYALKKILSKSDSDQLALDLKKILKKTKIDVALLDILPYDWEARYEGIGTL